MTVGELKELLSSYPEDFEITFGGILNFYRFKLRGEGVDLEFNESIYRDSTGKLCCRDIGTE